MKQNLSFMSLIVHFGLGETYIIEHIGIWTIGKTLQKKQKKVGILKQSSALVTIPLRWDAIRYFILQMVLRPSQPDLKLA